MAHNSTVFGQLLKWISRHEFDQLAKQHHQGQKLRAITRWDQFVALALGQLAGRQSLRDIEANMSAQTHKLYHLGSRPVAKSTLGRVNEQQPYTLFEALFYKLYARCQGVAPGHRFRFKNKLYSLDASLIDLSLKVFPWAHYALGKAAMKLHVGLDHNGYLPAFATVTEGKTADIDVARTLTFPKGSIVVCDKGYTDYAWYKSLTEKGVFFVTRQRTNAKYRVIERRCVDKATGLSCDQTIVLTGHQLKGQTQPALRRIGYTDPESGQKYVFLTSHFGLCAQTICAIYKERWQIELFFKWIKQNLKIKSFYGTRKNAVLTQIWTALCVNLLLAYLKYSARIGWSLQQMLRLLQLNLFARRDLLALLRGDPPPKVEDRQLALV